MATKNKKKNRAPELRELFRSACLYAIAARMEEIDMPPSRLAEKLKEPRKHVRQYLSGARVLKLGKLAKILDILGVSVVDIQFLNPGAVKVCAGKEPPTSAATEKSDG